MGVFIMFSIKQKLDSNLKIYINRSYYTNYRVLIKCKKFMEDITKKIPKLRGTVIREIKSLNLICAILTPKAINKLIEYPEVEFISFDDHAILYICSCSLSVISGMEQRHCRTIRCYLNVRLPHIPSQQWISLLLSDRFCGRYPDRIRI